MTVPHYELYLSLCLVVLVGTGLCTNDNDTTEFFPEVNIAKLGKVRGRVLTSHWSQRPIYSFQGIPYAVQPLGNLRFKAPRAAQPWSKTLDATAFKRRCPQVYDEDSTTEVLGSSSNILEDCLYLNVYTPMCYYCTLQIPKQNKSQAATQQKFPVIFYIHGGSFRVGSAHNMTPNYLLENNVVLVTIQYRLGCLGFLSLETDEIPGNMGFLDMLLALEWVHDHIRYFNGDKGSVTIVGQSAGGAAVTFFLTSPLVRDDLFHRAIMMSGSGLCNWSFENETGLGRKFTEKLGCLSSDWSKVNDASVPQCLRQKSLAEVFKVYLTVFAFDDKLNQGVKQSHGQKKFLTETPGDSFDKKAVKNVPVMIGVTKHEGSAFLEAVFQFLWNETIFDNLTDFKVQDLARQFMDYTHTSSPMVGHLVESGYLSQEFPTLKDAVPALADLAGLAVLKSCVFQTARMLSTMNNSTFLYSFHFKGRFTKFFDYRTVANFPHGVAHSDDLIYLFWDAEKPLNERELKVARSMVDLWTNFATHGRPFSDSVPVWHPMGNDSVGPFLRIDETSELRSNFLEEFNIATREGVEAYYAENGGAPTRLMGRGLGGFVWTVVVVQLMLMLIKDGL
uniref:Carboxylesterase 1C n=1 Tax=Cacopsylla melanoneura TaxID=428564 RepID=A0A8D9DZ52_9HEMI